MIEKKNKISDFVLSMVIEWRSVVFEVYHFVLTINGDGKQVAFGLWSFHISNRNNGTPFHQLPN